MKLFLKAEDDAEREDHVILEFSSIAAVREGTLFSVKRDLRKGTPTGTPANVPEVAPAAFCLTAFNLFLQFIQIITKL